VEYTIRVEDMLAPYSIQNYGSHRYRISRHSLMTEVGMIGELIAVDAIFRIPDAIYVFAIFYISSIESQTI
jgi:hypothetical protein